MDQTMWWALAAVTGALIGWLGRHLAARRAMVHAEEAWSARIREAESRYTVEAGKVAHGRETLARLQAEWNSHGTRLRARIGELEAFPGRLAEAQREWRALQPVRSRLVAKEAEAASLAVLVREYEPMPRQIETLETERTLLEKKLQAASQRIGELVPLAELAVAWRGHVAAKDREVAELWQRIHQLSPLPDRLHGWETHHQATVRAKDEEILSLIERLKRLEDLPEVVTVQQRRLSQAEAELEARRVRTVELASLAETLLSPEPEPARAMAATVGGAPAEVADDLKRIWGIGPTIEKRLNEMGVYRFEQIGRWSDDEIERFQEQLPEFPGRIRRDAWVKVAREQYQKKYRQPLSYS